MQKEELKLQSVTANNLQLLGVLLRPSSRASAYLFSLNFLKSSTWLGG
jgi:hypothetical protein